MERRVFCWQLLLTVLIANALLGTFLLIYSEELPSTISYLAQHQAGRYEDSPSQPFNITKAWQEYLKLSSFDKSHQGLINDPDYCNKVAAYRQEHPLTLGKDGLPVKNERVMLSDYNPQNLVKTAIKDLGVVAHPDHYLEKKEYKSKDTIRNDILIFHHKTPYWHLYHKIGRNFLCPGQRYNHIPGHEHFVNKDEVGTLNRRYAEHYRERPHCYDPWWFMPETLDLSKTRECTEFFTRLNKEENQSAIKWIKKKSRNSHNAEGVEVVNQAVADKLNEDYEGGQLCGSIRDKYIVQHYIDNPLLINQKKFDFRVYMIIANMDPLMLLYHDGFLRVSLLDFNQTSNDTMAHVTNTQLAKNMLSAKNATDEEWEETMTKQMWTFPTFEEYMIREGKVQPGWLENYVRKVMKVKMLHLTRMVYEKMLRHPGVYELYGVDFMFDENLNLWFLEVNRSPAMQATTEEKGRIQSKMTKDLLRIEFALITGTDLDAIIADTGYEWIFDGRKEGLDRYQGLVSSDCV